MKSTQRKPKNKTASQTHAEAGPIFAEQINSLKSWKSIFLKDYAIPCTEFLEKKLMILQKELKNF